MPYETRPAVEIRYHVWSRYLSFPKRDFGFYSDRVDAFKEALEIKRTHPDDRVFVREFLEDFFPLEDYEIVLPKEENA